MLWSGFSLKQISRWTMVTAKSVLLTINCLCVKVFCLSCVIFLTSKMAELTFTMRKKAAGHMRNNLPQAVFKKSIKITEYTFIHLIWSSSTKLVGFHFFPSALSDLLAWWLRLPQPRWTGRPEGLCLLPIFFLVSLLLFPPTNFL